MKFPPLLASNANLTEFKSLYVHTIVSFTTTSGTPGLVGTPKVRVPEPDLTNKASECP